MEMHRLLLGVIVLGVIMVTLFLGKPSITGFVPTETVSQKLDIHVTESQRFVLTASSGALKLSSFALTGTVAGNGLVNVYLSDGSNKWLAFSNKKKQGTSLEQITGLVSLEIEPGERLDSIESLPDDYITEDGAFNKACAETCMLDESMFNKAQLFLDVIIEPGTTVHISELTFSSTVEN